MSRFTELVKWVRRGKQREAVFRVLRRPMTNTWILSAAGALAPRIRKQDVWLILKEMKERGLVLCFNPDRPTGRLHCLTDTGRKLFKRLTGEVPPAQPTDVNWNIYADLTIARVRREVLLEIGRKTAFNPQPNSASGIRRRLHGHLALSLNAVLRALTELKESGLVEPQGRRPIEYHLTELGARMAGTFNNGFQ